MAMKLVKKTTDYSIYARGDSRYAVKDGNRQPVNGEEGLIKVTEPRAPAEPEAEPEAEAEGAEEASAEGDAEEAEAPEGDEAAAQ